MFFDQLVQKLAGLLSRENLENGFCKPATRSEESDHEFAIRGDESTTQSWWQVVSEITSVETQESVLDITRSFGV